MRKTLALLIFLNPLSFAQHGVLTTVASNTVTVFQPVNWNSNATAAKDNGGAVSPTTLTTMTVGTLNNRALIAFVGFDAVAATMGNVTAAWDPSGANQSMTLLEHVDASDSSGSEFLFGLLNPTSGNKNLTVSWDSGASQECIVMASDFYNVNQAGGSGSFANGTTNFGTSTTPNITITSSSGGMTVEGGNQAHSTVPLITSATQTAIFVLSGVGAANPVASYSSGSVSNRHAWTITSDPWEETGVELVPATMPTVTYNGNLTTNNGTGRLQVQ